MKNYRKIPNPITGKMQRVLSDDYLEDLIKVYVDRGDPTAWDATEATLTETLTWTDWDLSSIVPVGAKAVLIRVRIKTNPAFHAIIFREKGNSNILVAGATRTQVANVWYENQVIVACDSDRVIQYYLSFSPVDMEIVIGGWFI